MMKSTWKLATVVGLSGLALAGSAQAEVKLGGYLDTQVNWVKDGAAGINLSEGAIKLSSEMGNGSAMLDLPLYLQNRNVGTTVGLLGDRAQAYVAFKYDSGLNWKLGQFDSLYGAEANDSVDFRYAKHGAIYSLTPNSHAGIAVGYAMSDSMGFTALIAAPGVAGEFETGKKVRFGLVADMKMGLDTKVGLLFNDMAKDMLVDVVVGTHAGDMHLGAEVVASIVKGADMGLGFGLDAVMMMDDALSLGIRPEYLMKIGSNYSQLGVTVGPQYKLTDNLKVKADYTLDNAKATKDATAHTGHSVNIAAVYGF